MRSIIYSILTALLFTLGIAAQPTSKPAGELFLHVDAEGGAKLDLKAADLAKLARREVKGKDHDGKEHAFSGVELKVILQLAGVKFGEDLRGPKLAMYLLVEAGDGYHAVFALPEIDSEFTDRLVILADTMDGKSLDAKTGPWQIIVPDEKKHGRWVRQVTKLTVRSAVSDFATRADADSLSDEDAVRKVILEAVLSQWPASYKESNIFYIGVDDKKDPSDMLLQSFSGLKIRIKKASESFISRETSVLDKKSKKQGVLLSVSKLTWKNKNEAEAAAGTYEGNMASTSCVYTAKRENGVWKISAAVRCMVA